MPAEQEVEERGERVGIEGTVLRIIVKELLVSR